MIAPRAAGILVLLGSVSGLLSQAVGQTVMDITVDSATTVLDEIMSIPANQIPRRVISGARAIAIIPNVVKGGFVVGIRHGRGVILVRDHAGNWGAPAFATLTGGSVGWQAGIQSTDVVLVFRSERGIDGLSKGKLTIGVDAAAAAGPVGRQVEAATDAALRAEILSYSRSRGLFAGVSIEGSSLQLDEFAANAYYGATAPNDDGDAPHPLPASAVRLMNRLAQYAGSGQTRLEPIEQPASATVTRTPVADLAERLRLQLLASWEQLAPMLDERWREYLAIPREVVAGGSVEAAELRGKLTRYDTVAGDEQYANLTRTAAFHSTHQLLLRYAETVAARSPGRVVLPPPPIDED